jgi:hypothetical protein
VRLRNILIRSTIFALSGAAFGAFSSSLAFAIGYHLGFDQNPPMSRAGFGWAESSLLGCLYGVPFGAATGMAYLFFETKPLNFKQGAQVLIYTLIMMIVGENFATGFGILVFGLLTFIVAIFVVRKR